MRNRVIGVSLSVGVVPVVFRKTQICSHDALFAGLVHSSKIELICDVAVNDEGEGTSGRAVVIVP